MNIILNDFPETVKPKTIVAIDTEIYGMRKHRLHWPNEGTFASLQFTMDGETVYVIDKEDLVKEAMARIMPGTHVFHNAYFDIRHLRRWCDYPDKPEVYDTMLIEKLLYSNYYDRFGLADLARRYFDIIVSKGEREDFVTKNTFTREMLEYAAKDAEVTYKIFKEQAKQFKSRPDVQKVWKTVDLPALYAILDFKPTQVNVQKWEDLAIEAENISTSLKKDIQETYGVLASSPAQVTAKLHSMGYKVEGSGVKILNGLLKKHGDIDFVEKLIRFRKYQKRATSYGRNWLEKYFEDDGTSIPGFSVSEAITGRMSSKAFNFQQIPATPEYRSCIIPPEGHKILVVDYSAQEPRVTAFESKDKKLMELTHIPGESIHVNVGRELFNDPTLTKKDKRYKAAKGCNLGIQYGLTPIGLQRDLNDKKEEDEPQVTLEDATELMNHYFATFPGVKKWADRQKNLVYKPGYVETRLGRRTWLNPYNWKSKNNALNSPIQGGAADIMKIAVSKIREYSYKLYKDWWLFGVVHDEIDASPPAEYEISGIIDTEFLDTYRKFCENIMIKVAEKVYPGVKFEVESETGDDWSVK